MSPDGPNRGSGEGSSSNNSLGWREIVSQLAQAKCTALTEQLQDGMPVTGVHVFDDELCIGHVRKPCFDPLNFPDEKFRSQRP